MKRKLHPLIRLIKIIAFIKEENRKNRFPTLLTITNNLSAYISTMDYDAELTGISTASFNRDLKKIRSEFGLDLIYDKSTKGYTIADSELENSFLLNAMEAFEIFSTIEFSNNFPSFIIPEKRKSIFLLDDFHFLIKSIKDRKLIQFNYRKYDTGIENEYNVLPIALKESERRWYLIAALKETYEIRAFGMDRMSLLIESGGQYRKKDFNIEDIKEKYDACFAMFYTEEKAEQVILEFDDRDLNYVQSFPIHHSQRIIIKKDRKQVELTIKITDDFIKELLSRAWSIKVIKPSALRKKLHKIFKEAVKRNA